MFAIEVCLVAGRPEGPARSLPYQGNTGHSERRIPAEYDRPGRATAWAPEDDAAYLRSHRDRADDQRKKAELERRERESDGA